MIKYILWFVQYGFSTIAIILSILSLINTRTTNTKIIEIHHTKDYTQFDSTECQKLANDIKKKLSKIKSIY